MQQNLQNICLKTGAPMESHAAAILKPFAFSKLQEQLILAAHYASFQMEDGFLVRHHMKLDGGRKVYWVHREGIVSCSCHQFEFSGILCRHALRVLSTGNCFQIPERYLRLRWRRISIPSTKLLHCVPSDHAERVQLLQSMVSTLITESAKSKERLDIAMEHVSVLLSRIRDQPVLPQEVKRALFKMGGMEMEIFRSRWYSSSLPLKSMGPGPWWSCDLTFFLRREGVAGGKEDAEGGGRRWELGVIEGSSKAENEVGKSPKGSSEVVV
ncbi:hypothetical protein RHSIM_RhsimUnG0201800 [Rhododendron simsii]|uniref:Protein FAR1-RELATED SEQUENCE n=1 Tax=Rhododendron simsii TaxID=118357 RepID=A0A834FU75_RHOSS|nr:hypothetical protein RHSIM_RhsimUnG0201800 [Rhododendron simsii]